MTIGFKATLEIHLTQVEDVFKTMRFGEVIRYCFTITCKHCLHLHMENLADQLPKIYANYLPVTHMGSTWFRHEVLPLNEHTQREFFFICRCNIQTVLQTN